MLQYIILQWEDLDQNFGIENYEVPEVCFTEKNIICLEPIRGNSESGHGLDFSVSYYVTMLGPVWVLREELLIDELSLPLQTVDSDLETIQSNTQRIAGLVTYRMGKKFGWDQQVLSVLWVLSNMLSLKEPPWQSWAFCLCK